MKLSNNKIKHAHAVAEWMYLHAHEYNLDPERMYVLGLLHDIGYLRGKTGHANNGAEITSKIGLDHEMIYAIKNHGMDLRYLEVTPELLLLVRADLQIDYEGDFIGYEARIGGIKVRYGEDSIQYKRVAGTYAYLKEKGEA